MRYHGVEDEMEHDDMEMEDDENQLKPGKKCPRCGRFMRGGGYCCSSESPKSGKKVTDNPDGMDVDLPKARKSTKKPPKIGSLAEDIFGS